MKEKSTWHPILFASYGVLTLVASNITEVRLEALRALLVTVGVTAFVLILLKFILKDAVKAGLISSVAVVLIFSYGHVKTIMPTWIVGESVPLVLGSVWGLLFGLWTYWVLKKLQDPDPISDYFWVVSLILNVFPIYTIVSFYFQTRDMEQYAHEYLQQAWSDTGIVEAQRAIEEQKAESHPDIYYIILDAYLRSDLLEELYDYDNSEFVNFLESRGFYVAEESRANYINTEKSLASSLNMIHINTLPEFLCQDFGCDTDWPITQASTEMLRENWVVTALQNQGYTCVAFDTGFSKTVMPNADYFLTSPKLEEEAYTAWNAFELLLLDTSLGQIYTRLRGGEHVQLQSLFDAHRERVLFTLDNVGNYADADGNYFVFAHVLSPHKPYIFGPNGEEIDNVGAYTLAKTDSQVRTYELYRDQLHYLNSLVMEVIDQILANSDTPPIIILQGDHGSKVYPSNEHSVEMEIKVTLPILNAYYFPGIDDEKALYSSITPVNSFRAVFNNYFGTNLELLEDDSYFLEKNAEYKFINPCQGYSTCPPE